MASFPQFGLLPLELQREIWQHAMQIETPGLLIVFSNNGSSTGDGDGEGSGGRGPPRADVDLHSLMHVCRESRAMAQAHFRYTMRHHGHRRRSSAPANPATATATALADGAFLGARRDFRPDLDVLYIPTDRYDGFFDWRFLDGWPASQQPHHLALDGHEAQLSRGGVGAQVGALVASNRLPDLTSVSLIFAAEPAPVPEYSPKRAYKLADLGAGDLVWCALPDGCKYEDTDPRRLAEWWKTNVVLAAGEAEDRRDLRALQVVPRRIAVRRYADISSKGWLSSTFELTARLRHMLV